VNVRQQWKDQSHHLTLSWGGCCMKIVLSRDGMHLNCRGVGPGVIDVLRRAHDKAQGEGQYSAFVQRVRDASTTTDSVSEFLRRVEMG
jgi:hypothetical protein